MYQCKCLYINSFQTSSTQSISSCSPVATHHILETSSTPRTLPNPGAAQYGCSKTEVERNVLGSAPALTYDSKPRTEKSESSVI